MFTIKGDNRDNLIYALGGGDEVYGLDGNDTLFGGAGIDFLYGNTGNDLLRGGDQNDRLYGGAGWDLLFGDNGDDLLSGELGNDTLKGGNGNDTLNGDEGKDYLYGGNGTDRLTGGAGDDEFAFFAGAGSQEGADHILDFSVGHDMINLGPNLKWQMLDINHDDCLTVDDTNIVSRDGKSTTIDIGFALGQASGWQVLKVTADTYAPLNSESFLFQ